MIDMKRSFPYTDVHLFHFQHKAKGKVCLHHSCPSRTYNYVLIQNDDNEAQLLEVKMSQNANFIEH
jgi:hypothetical protein